MNRRADDDLQLEVPTSFARGLDDRDYDVRADRDANFPRHKNDSAPQGG